MNRSNISIPTGASSHVASVMNKEGTFNTDFAPGNKRFKVSEKMSGVVASSSPRKRKKMRISMTPEEHLGPRGREPSSSQARSELFAIAVTPTLTPEDEFKDEMDVEQDADANQYDTESDCPTDDETKTSYIPYYQSAAQTAIDEERFMDAEGTLCRIVESPYADPQAKGEAYIKLALIHAELDEFKDAIGVFATLDSERCKDVHMSVEKKARGILEVAEKMFEKKAYEQCADFLKITSKIDVNNTLVDQGISLIPDLQMIRAKALVELKMFARADIACKKAHRDYKKVRGSAPTRKLQEVYKLRGELMRFCGNPDADAFIAHHCRELDDETRRSRSPHNEPLQDENRIGEAHNDNAPAASPRGKAHRVYDHRGASGQPAGNGGEAAARKMLSQFHLSIVDGEVAGRDDLILDFITDMMKTRDMQRLELFVKFWKADRGVVGVDTRDSLPTLLHLVSCWANYDAVSYLLSLGAPIDAVDIHGFTPLHYACEANSQLVIKILLENGADVNYKSKVGSAPLHTAAIFNRGSAASLLFDMAAADLELEASDKDGKTALHHASEQQEGKSILRLLLHHGANINAVDKKGCTPLHLAVLQKLPCTAEVLLQRNADMKIRNTQGKTALELAKPNSKIRKLFEIEKRMREEMDTDSP